MSYYCGIELDAIKTVICVIDDNADIVLRHKHENNLQRLIDMLSKFQPDLVSVVESTFNWDWLVDGLSEHGFKIYLAHARGVTSITRGKHKTDPRDAKKLAELLRLDSIPCGYIYPRNDRPIRDMIRFRQKIVNRRSSEIIAVRAMLYRRGRSDHDAAMIKRMNHDDLSKFFSHPITIAAAAFHLEQIALFSSQISYLEKTVLQYAKKKPEFSILLTLPGIGPINALAIAYEVGEISRFNSHTNFVSYCRLFPGEAKSAKRSMRPRDSKNGNPYLKRAFTNAAVHAVKNSKAVKKHHTRHLNRRTGKCRRLIANNIVAHKLAIAVFYMLKNQEPYREELLFR